MSNREDAQSTSPGQSSSGSNCTDSSGSSDVDPLSQLPNDDKKYLVMILDAEEYNDKMKQARSEYEKRNRNKAHLKLLLKESYPNRRGEVKRMDEEGMPMMSSIIIDWSCFLSGEYVS